jgi:hypothetical protein
MTPPVTRRTSSYPWADQRGQVIAQRRPRDLLPAHGCAYHFFRVISLRTSSSAVRLHLFQPADFLLELPEPLHIRRLQAPEVFPPAVDRLRADACFLATSGT